MTREEFVMAAEIAFEKLMAPTKGIAPAFMDDPMREKGWSLKELAAHLTHWDAEIIRRLEVLYQGGTIGPLPEGDERERVNAEVIARRRLLSVKRVMNEFRVTHSTLIEAVRRVPDEILCPDGEIPEWLIRSVLLHYEHHTPSVEGWAEKRKMRDEG